MSIISITPDRTRSIIVRGDTYYPATLDERVNVVPTDAYHYIICVRDGDAPAADGSIPLYEVYARPSIDWSKPDTLHPVELLVPHFVYPAYYDLECTAPAATAITIDGAEYVFCVLLFEAEFPSIDDGILRLTRYALRGADESTVYAFTWQGPIDYDKADVRLYHKRARTG